MTTILPLSSRTSCLSHSAAQAIYTRLVLGGQARCAGALTERHCEQVHSKACLHRTAPEASRGPAALLLTKLASAVTCRARQKQTQILLQQREPMKLHTHNAGPKPKALTSLMRGLSTGGEPPCTGAASRAVPSGKGISTPAIEAQCACLLYRTLHRKSCVTRRTVGLSACLREKYTEKQDTRHRILGPTCLSLSLITHLPHSKIGLTLAHGTLMRSDTGTPPETPEHCLQRHASGQLL